MPFRLTFITSLALMYMAGGLYLAFVDDPGFVGKRAFFIVFGILAWFIGNKLVELEERIAGLEQAAPVSKAQVPATNDQ